MANELRVKNDWAAQNPERHKENGRRYYEANREKVLARSKQRRAEKAAEIREYMKGYGLRQYNLTVEEYDTMHATQNGLCAICRLAETRIDKRTGIQTRLVVDHCHTTGAVRGLLCFSCNLAVGQMGDDIARLRAAADYLEANSGE